MSHYFGLHPWHIDDLTPDEVHVYRTALADIEREPDHSEGTVT